MASQLELGKVEDNVLEVREVVQPLGIEVFRQVEGGRGSAGRVPTGPGPERRQWGETGGRRLALGLFLRNASQMRT